MPERQASGTRILFYYKRSTNEDVTSDLRPTNEDVTSDSRPPNNKVTSDSRPSNTEVTSDLRPPNNEVTSDSQAFTDEVTSDSQIHIDETTDSSPAHNAPKVLPNQLKEGSPTLRYNPLKTRLQPMQMLPFSDPEPTTMPSTLDTSNQPEKQTDPLIHPSQPH